MKSRITIEVDFENGNNPVIQILQTNSDDVRDKLVGQFLQSLNGSSWCNIRWAEHPFASSEVVPFRILISPITPKDYEKEAAAMLEQKRLDDKFNDAAAKLVHEQS